MATPNKKAPVRKSSTMSSSRPKSRVGGSGLARSKKPSLFSKRNGLIAAGLAAIVGVVAVAFSFASTTPDYQYSFNDTCTADKVATTNTTASTTTTTTTPAATDADKIKAQQKCYDNSAQGGVYRIYKGVFNREPNQAEYAYWTQQLAGERTPVTEFASKMIASSGAVVPKTATDAQFVAGLYKNMLLRTDAQIAADKKGTDYWVKKLQGKNKWSRQRMVYHFANTGEAKRANANATPGFNDYLVKATPVKVVQNAKADQLKRLAQMNNYAKLAQASANGAKKHENAAKTALSAAKGSSSLDAIKANKETAKSEAAKARADARTAKSTAAAAGRLKAKAKALADYATDIAQDPAIGMTKISAPYKLTVAFSKNANSSASAAGKTLAQIDAAYAAREAKIAADAAAAAAKNAGSTSDDGSVPADITTTTGEVVHPAQCADKSQTRIATAIHNKAYSGLSKECIAWFQYKQGKSVDGKVGSETKTAADQVFLALALQGNSLPQYVKPTGACNSNFNYFYIRNHGPGGRFIACAKSPDEADETKSSNWAYMADLKKVLSCPAHYALSPSNNFNHKTHPWFGATCKKS